MDGKALSDIEDPCEAESDRHNDIPRPRSTESSDDETIRSYDKSASPKSEEMETVDDEQSTSRSFWMTTDSILNQLRFFTSLMDGQDNIEVHVHDNDNEATPDERPEDVDKDSKCSSTSIGGSSNSRTSGRTSSSKTQINWRHKKHARRERAFWSRWNLLGLVVLVLVIVVAVVVPVRKKNRSQSNENEESSHVCVEDEINELNENRLELFLVGLTRPATGEEQVAVETAVVDAYNEISGKCEDIYERWMYQSHIVSQRLKIQDDEEIDGTATSYIVAEIEMEISCNDCPEGQEFADSYPDISRRILRNNLYRGSTYVSNGTDKQVRKLPGDDEASKIDVDDVIRVIEANLYAASNANMIEDQFTHISDVTIRSSSGKSYKASGKGKGNAKRSSKSSKFSGCTDGKGKGKAGKGKTKAGKSKGGKGKGRGDSSSPSMSPSSSSAPSCSLEPSSSPTKAPTSDSLPITPTPTESTVPSMTPSKSSAPSTMPSKSQAPSHAPSVSSAPSRSSEPSMQPSLSAAPSAAPSVSLAPSEFCVYEGDDCPELNCGVCPELNPQAGEVVVKVLDQNGCPLSLDEQNPSIKFQAPTFLASAGSISSCCEKKNGKLVSAANDIARVCVGFNQYDSFFIEVDSNVREVTFFLHEFCVALEGADGTPCTDDQTTCGQTWRASSYVPTYTGIATGWGTPSPGTNQVCELTLEYGDAVHAPPDVHMTEPPESQLVYYLTMTNAQPRVHFQQSLVRTTAWATRDENGAEISCSAFPPGRSAVTQTMRPVTFEITDSPCMPSSCAGFKSPVNSNGGAVDPFYQFQADMFRTDGGCCSRTRVRDSNGVGWRTDANGQAFSQFLPSLSPSPAQIGGSPYRDEANLDLRRVDGGTAFGFKTRNTQGIPEQRQDTVFYFGPGEDTPISVIPVEITVSFGTACMSNRAQVRFTNGPFGSGFAFADVEISDSDTQPVSIFVPRDVGELGVDFFCPDYNPISGRYCTKAIDTGMFPGPNVTPTSVAVDDLMCLTP